MKDSCYDLFNFNIYCFIIRYHIFESSKYYKFCLTCTPSFLLALAFPSLFSKVSSPYFQFEKIHLLAIFIMRDITARSGTALRCLACACGACELFLAKYFFVVPRLHLRRLRAFLSEALLCGASLVPAALASFVYFVTKTINHHYVV